MLDWRIQVPGLQAGDLSTRPGSTPQSWWLSEGLSWDENPYNPVSYSTHEEKSGGEAYPRRQDCPQAFLHMSLRLWEPGAILAWDREGSVWQNYAFLRPHRPSQCSFWLSESLCLNARECKETETEDESFSRQAGPLPRRHRETSQQGVLPLSCGSEAARVQWADSSPNSYLTVNWGLSESTCLLSGHWGQVPNLKVHSHGVMKRWGW